MQPGVIWHPGARLELQEAALFYEDRCSGLGTDFRDEVWQYQSAITANPLRYSIRIADVRRANLKRFPFHINFLIHDGRIAIVAISHHRRRPYYWRERIENRAWLDAGPPGQL